MDGGMSQLQTELNELFLGYGVEVSVKAATWVAPGTITVRCNGSESVLSFNAGSMLGKANLRNLMRAASDDILAIVRREYPDRADDPRLMEIEKFARKVAA